MPEGSWRKMKGYAVEEVLFGFQREIEKLLHVPNNDLVSRIDFP